MFWAMTDQKCLGELLRELQAAEFEEHTEFGDPVVNRDLLALKQKKKEQ